MRPTILACLAVLFLLVAGCKAEPVATVSRSEVLAGRYAALESSAGPCGAPALVAATDGGVPLMAWGVDAGDHAKMGFAVPPEVLGCTLEWGGKEIADTGTNIKGWALCILSKLPFFNPTPASLKYTTYRAPARATAPAPCAPPRATAPCAPPPAKAPGCEPISLAPVCHDETCAVASK